MEEAPENNTGLEKWDGEVEIPTHIWVAMLIVAGLFEGLQWLATLTFVGVFITPFISVAAWLTFYITFKMYGMNFFSKPHRFLSMSAGGLIEVIPIANVLPGWMGLVILMWYREKKGRILPSFSGGTKTAE